MPGDSPAGPPDARVCVAQIGAAHGLRGEVRLHAYTADPLAVTRYGPLATEDGRVIEIASVRPSKDALVARLKGVADRNAAEALRNTRLFVPRERFAPAEDDEFYHADLIGLAAVDPHGAAFGTIVAVQNFGAGDILEIAPAGGGTSLLLAFTKAAVPQVDIAGGRVVIDLPDETPDADEPDGVG